MKLIKKLDRRKNKTGNHYNRWALFLCPYCNKEVERRYNTSLKCKSCGCMRSKLSGISHKIHGDNTKQERSKLYSVWASMKRRCDNPDNKRYRDYRGRGIKICKQWKEYIPFKEWAISNGYKKGLIIDRRDNNGNYKPDNCRWVTQIINNRNSRNTKLNWKKINEIRSLWKLNKYTQKEIGNIYDVSNSRISNIVNYKAWKE